MTPVVNGARARIGVDIGGTFTDILVLTGDGRLAMRKVQSTTDDYGRAIVEGIEALIAALDLSVEEIAEIRHGTTVATNAILEAKGARTALVTTEGFRDVLELRRIRAPKLYDLSYVKPEPLVPRRRRFEVRERIGPTGEVVEPLDDDSLAAATELVGESGVEAVAVCLLHSYANPAHEHAVAESLRRAHPDLYITCSADILPEIREYERSSTAAINSYVGPTVQTYLTQLLVRLGTLGLHAPLLVMQSHGGVTTADMAARTPAHIVESGPAAGVIASASLAGIAGYSNVITFDMGGTTAKAGTIENGEVQLTSEYEVGAGINTSSVLVAGGGYALKLPAIDIAEVGAGGGSICRVVRGRLHTGPDSAGSSPGPVCYGAGGAQTTVTDANAVLGFLNPEFIAGGSVRLDTERASRVLEADIARPLGLGVLEAAYGIHAIASATMARTVKAVTTFRGRDPRDFVLFAFGGSGPLHAAEMARLLGMRKIVVPPGAGLFSAFGLLFSEIRHHSVATFMKSAAPEHLADLNMALGALQAEARQLFVTQGYDARQVVVGRSVDLRYEGQGFELSLPITGAAELDEQALREVAEAFGAEHLRTYGHRTTDASVEIVNVRAAARVVAEHEQAYDPRALTHANGTVAERVRLAYFGDRFGTREARVLPRAGLGEDTVPGPIVVEEYDCTCVVPPDFDASVDGWGNLVLEART
jgi:N-methylhydantoinase A